MLAQLMRPGGHPPAGGPQAPADGLNNSMSGLDGPTFPHGNSLVATEDLIWTRMWVQAGLCVCVAAASGVLGLRWLTQ